MLVTLTLFVARRIRPWQASLLWHADKSYVHWNEKQKMNVKNSFLGETEDESVTDLRQFYFLRCSQRAKKIVIVIVVKFSSLRKMKILFCFVYAEKKA